MTYNPRQEQARHLMDSLPPHSTLYLPHDDYYLQQAVLYYANCHKCDRTKTIAGSSIPTNRPFFFVDSSVDEIAKLNNFNTSVHQSGQRLAEILEEFVEQTIIFSVRDESTRGLTNETKRSLKEFGLNVDRLGYGGSYVALVRNGDILNEKINNYGPAELRAEDVNIPGIDHILSAGFAHGQKSIIKINGKNKSRNLSGMNIVILASNLKVIRSFHVETFRTDVVFPGIYKAEPIDTDANTSSN